MRHVEVLHNSALSYILYPYLGGGIAKHYNSIYYKVNKRDRLLPTPEYCSIWYYSFAFLGCLFLVYKGYQKLLKVLYSVICTLLSVLYFAFSSFSLQKYCFSLIIYNQYNSFFRRTIYILFFY